MMFKPLLASLFVFAGTANATLLNFDYTFSNGSVLSGSFEGLVQSDNDTVFITAFGDVEFNGVQLPSIETGEFISISDYPAGGLQPMVSFSGNVMDVFTCSSGFVTGNCDFSVGGGFYFDSGLYGAGAGALHAGTQFEGYNANSWNLVAVPASIPEPISLALFGLGLAGFSLSRRTKRA